MRTISRNDRARVVSSGLDPSSSEPLWSQLVRELTQSLDRGEFRDAFPSEHELSERFKISRHTVREAIRQLTEQGRLYTIKGKGTFVSPWHDHLFASSYSLAKEITQSGVAESSVVLGQLLIVLDRDIPELGIGRGDQAFFVERVRKAGTEVVAINRSWFTEDLGIQLSGIDLSRGSIYEILESHCNVVITGGWEKIRAAIPSTSDRELLELEANQPVLSLERAAYSGKSVVEWRESLVRDDRFSLIAQWGSEVWHSNAVES